MSSIAAGSLLNLLGIQFFLSLYPIETDKIQLDSTAPVTGDWKQDLRHSRTIPWTVCHGVLQQITTLLLGWFMNTCMMSPFFKAPNFFFFFFLAQPLCQDLLKNELKEVQLPTFICREANARNNTAHWGNKAQIHSCAYYWPACWDTVPNKQWNSFFFVFFKSGIWCHFSSSMRFQFFPLAFVHAVSHFLEEISPE